jgi:PTS system nitrogen regulatory IIA component
MRLFTKNYLLIQGTTTMQKKDILTIKEVAEHLQVSERTVSDWAQKGEIPCGKLGNSWRFKRIEVERWLDKKLVGNKRESETPAVAIEEVLTKERVFFLDASVKREVMNALIDSLAQTPEIVDRDELAFEIFQREELMSTGIGLGVAIPHVRLPSLNKMIMSAALLRSGLEDYDSLDGQPVQLVFMIAAGHHQHAEYLKLLSSLANLVKKEAIRQQLIDSISPEDFFRTLGQQH